MKKSLLALAVLGAFAGAAQAQSAVTIYGSFDGGVRYQTNTNAAGDSKWSMGSNGTYNSNRLGFKGVEDLGGGMNAHFTLETGWNTGTGALENANNQLFGRTASVGLGGTWGAVDLGRQYTNAFLTVLAYDPFSFRYPLIAYTVVNATAGVRYNNDIKYTGNFGPVTARVEYALGEQAGDNVSGSSRSVSVSYKDGPIAAGAAYTDRRSVAVAAAPATATTAAVAAAPSLQTKDWTIGGAYTFGPARVTAGYEDAKAATVAGVDQRSKTMWAGLNYNVTPALEITPAWYRVKADGVTVGRKDIYMLNAAYALSKRTNLYALIDQQRYKDALRPAGQERQNDLAIGVNHLF